MGGNGKRREQRGELGEPQAYGTSGLRAAEESLGKIELNSTVCNF